jgi:hypothetical protein
MRLSNNSSENLKNVTAKRRLKKLKEKKPRNSYAVGLRACLKLLSLFKFKAEEEFNLRNTYSVFSAPILRHLDAIFSILLTYGIMKTSCLTPIALRNSS